MKKMYNESFKHNAIIVVACLFSVSLLFSVDAYLDAKEAARKEARRNNSEVKHTSYFDYVDNGFTLN